MKKKAHFWFLQNTSGGGLALPSLAEPTWGWRAEMRDWGPNHGAHPSSKTGHREGLGAPGWGAPTAPQSQLEGRSQPTWVSSSPSASPAFPSPGVFLIRFIFFLLSVRLPLPALEPWFLASWGTSGSGHIHGRDGLLHLKGQGKESGGGGEQHSEEFTPSSYSWYYWFSSRERWAKERI